MDSLIQVLLVGGIFGTALLAVATSLGIQVQEIRHELELLRGMLGAKTPARSALD
jgi:hypothetical protein